MLTLLLLGTNDKKNPNLKGTVVEDKEQVVGITDEGEGKREKG